MTREKAQSAANNDGQMYAALTFAFILIVVGVPLWWYTTQVYRIALPYAEMNSLRPDVIPSMSIKIFVATRDPDRSKRLAQLITVHFSRSPLYNVTALTAVVSDRILTRASSLQELDKELERTYQDGAVHLVEVADLGKIAQLEDQCVLEKNTIFISPQADAASLIAVLDRHIFQDEEPNKRLLQSWVERTPSARHFAAEPAYDVLVTVLHPAPGAATVNFDVVKTIEEYMEPFVKELQPVCELHVKSQWLHFVDLQPNPAPRLAADNRTYILSQTALPHLITPLEKKLGSHVAARTIINLVVWLPPCEWAPLHIEASTGGRLLQDAFISPRWGGIQIYNPPAGSCDVDVDGKVVMGIFIHQLRLLLGLSTPNVAGAPHPAITVREKNAFIRRRTIEFLSSAKHTLKSLSELLGKISNIVINDEVGGSIFAALDSVRECEVAIAEGRLMDAHAAAVAAHLAAETAFTAPSLLALLYFPEDQKYAVYIPLFLPVMIPVLISFKPMREWFLAKWSSRKKKTD